MEQDIQKQIEFLDDSSNVVEKEEISDTERTSIEQVEMSGSTHVDINDGYFDTSIIVVPRVDLEYIQSSECPVGLLNPRYDEIVRDGIKLGKRLSKKLKTRSEERTTIYNRQKVGKIDKRSLSGLGYGNENVFQFHEVDKFKKVNVHLSIDGSSSMSGTTWNETLKMATALCVGFDSVPNIDIQVTIRATSNDYSSTPYVVTVYDSLVDKISKVKKIFPYLNPNGLTPEGLILAGIQKSFIPSDSSVDSYFINISDGEPFVNTNTHQYSGMFASRHTRKQIKKMEMKGIKILSYFANDPMYDVTESIETFNQCYGKSNTKFIDNSNIGEISKTLNELFLKK